MQAVNAEGDSAWSDSGLVLYVPENTTDLGKLVSLSDFSGNNLTFALSGSDAASFAINSNGHLKVKAGTTLDYESATTSYSLAVSVTDDNSTVLAAYNIVIYLTDVNEPPPKLAAPTVVANSKTPASKLDASWTAPTTTQMTGKPAVDDYDVRYKKTGDSTWSELVKVTKSIATSATLDNLTSGKTYEVQVRAGNAEGDGPWSDSGTAITVAGGVTRSVAENSAAGTNVGAAVTAKANANYTYTYSLDGTDKDDFSIGSSTGQITVGTGTSLDYETKSSYSVTVKVAVADKTQNPSPQSLDPNAPGNYTIPVTINVTNVNETPDLPGQYGHP